MQVNQSQSSKAQFLNGLKDLVLTETAAQRQQVHTHWEKPLAARVADGYAIENITLKEISDDELVVLHCGRNISRFRPGDILCLSRNNPFDHEALMVNLVEDEETELLISCDSFVDWDAVFA